jgi:hypothetical protein
VVVWGLLAVLVLVGSGRSPKALHELVAGVDIGEPGWLAYTDHLSASLFLHYGTAVAILLAAVCVIVALGVYLPPRLARGTLVLAIVVFATIWVAVQDFGGILAGGATDPNSGPLIVLLAVAYWPLIGSGPAPGSPAPGSMARDRGV